MPPRSVAQAFADHLNPLLNRTVTDARPMVIGDPSHPARLRSRACAARRPVSLALHGSSVRLLAVQALQVTGEHCQTLPTSTACHCARTSSVACCDNARYWA